MIHFLYPAMEQRQEKKRIKARPTGKIIWFFGVGYVLFRDPKTNKKFVVKGMTVKGGKGAWALYNRKFAKRTFTISLNAGGQGVHYAEGIRWDESTREWIPVVMGKKILLVVAQGAFETPSCFIDNFVWDPINTKWCSDHTEFNVPLYRRTGTTGELNCWKHRMDYHPCDCKEIADLRKQLEGAIVLVENRVCHLCMDDYLGESCPTCPGFYIRKSLLNLEPHCPICLEDNDLDKCVAVRGSFLSGCCSHSFHGSCIAKWFHDGNTVCPICRCDHRSDDSDENAGSDGSDGSDENAESDENAGSDYGDDTDDVDDGCDCRQCSFYRGRH